MIPPLIGDDGFLGDINDVLDLIALQRIRDRSRLALGNVSNARTQAAVRRRMEELGDIDRPTVDRAAFWLLDWLRAP